MSKSSTGSFSAGISGLAEDTTYHFRAVASNGVGPDYGLDRNFTTPQVHTPDICSWIAEVGLDNLTVDHALYIYSKSEGAEEAAQEKYNSLDPKPPEIPDELATRNNFLGVYDYSIGAIYAGNVLTGCSFAGPPPSTSANVKIYAFDQNPAGYDEGNEWVELYNPTNHTIDITNWKLKTRYGGGKIVTVPEGSEIAPNDYWFFTCSTGFLRNENESITLMDSLDNEIDRTCDSSDFENNNRFCMRDPDCLDTDSDTDWIFQAQRLEKWKRRNGTVTYVVDGDTIDISPVERAYIQRIRLVGVDTPERGEPGYEEAKSFVNETCFGKEVYFDVDNCKHYDKYHRILAVIYVNVNGTWINLNAELLKRGYADIMYIPPSEFNPYEWIVN